MKASRRKQRMVQKLRQLVIMERRYAVALRRLRRSIARDAARQDSLIGMRTVIEDRVRDIERLHASWLQRVVEMFGRENIRYLQERVGQATKANAYDLFLSVIRAWIELKAVELSRRVSRRMIDDAKDTLARSFDQGWGIAKTAREMVKALGGTMGDNTRIARTELHTASGVGSDQAARSTGLDMIKEWGATEDQRTRESHEIAGGQRREMDQPFDVGDSKLMFAGDPNGPAEEVIQCRCTTFYHPRINGVVYD